VIRDFSVFSNFLAIRWQSTGLVRPVQPRFMVDIVAPAAG